MRATYDCLVIGCGFAGAVIAREMAERGGKKVLVIEKRDHIGGGAYDLYDDNGILIHQYGPHIFHTNNNRVFDYLSRFTQFRAYAHEVLADVHGQLIPVPFNLNALHIAFEPQKARILEEKLTGAYGAGRRVTISELREQPDPDIAQVAEYVYNNIFLHYTQKQWGVSPDEIDPSVTARVPILISRDNRYFQDSYQGLPSEGYTRLFERMLDHENIEVQCNTDAADMIRVQAEAVTFNGAPFSGPVIYTGAIDALFDYRFGRLPYRTLDFLFETHDRTWYQPKGTVNYTVDKPYTRITEFKHLTGQELDGKTTIMKEYPKEYKGAPGETPYYPIANPENHRLYETYKAAAQSIPCFYLLGRLAEYKYYNMDGVIERALTLADNIVG